MDKKVKAIKDTPSTHKRRPTEVNLGLVNQNIMVDFYLR